jgi:glycerophosphoryl diester phosphodiesterase
MTKKAIKYFVFFFGIQLALSQTDRIIFLKEKLETPNDNHVMVVAHRGDWRNAPENSLQAIQYCIDMGVDMVEIDVRKTKDGHIVLMHDGSIDRTTNGTGLVKNLTLDSLKTFKLLDGLRKKTPHTIPTLEEALQLTKNKILVNLDKAQPIFNECVAIAKSTKTFNQIVFKSSLPYSKIKNTLDGTLNNAYFMPMIKLNNPDCEPKINDYLSHMTPIAIAIGIPKENRIIMDQFQTFRNKGTSIWVNALWPKHNAGNDDEKAALNPDVYHWYLKNNVDIIQTDRPKLLLDFLRSKKLHD